MDTTSKIQINTVMQETEEGVSYFTTISDQMVTEYTKDLDNVMIRINGDVVTADASDYQLEKYVLELSNILYFLGQRLETMGIKDDISKLNAKQVYNDAYLNAPVEDGKKKPTVAELSAMAEDKSKYETIMNNIYSRAYRQIKFKIDAAYEMLASLRKIISKRMQEAQLSMQRNNGTLAMGNDTEEVY